MKKVRRKKKSSSMSGIVVHKPNMKRVRAQISKLKKRRGQFWKPKPGKNVIRIMPPWSSEGVWYKEVLTHYISDDQGKTQAINCPQIKERRCAICEYRQKLRESKSTLRQKQADKLKPSLSCFANVVDLDDPESGPQVGKLSEKTVNSLLEYFMDSEWGDFTHPVNGYDVILRRSGEGLGTTYETKLRREPSKISSVSWLKNLNNLDDKFPIATYAETRAVLEDGGDDEEEDEDEYEEEEDTE